MEHDHGHDHDLAELLDLDAEVLHGYHGDVIAWVASLLPARPRVVDLGAGSGTGALALARQLPEADVVAVDVSESMLERIRRKAREQGVDGRVRTVLADLDEPWPSLGPADLVWASNSLHHVADPGHVLALIYGLLAPGGMLALSEMEKDSMPRFLPGDAGAAMEDRWHAAMADARAEAGMHMGEDWDARLAGAGFTVEAERRFDIMLRPPLPAAAARYAQVSLERMRHALDGRLAASDLAAIEAAAAAIPGRADLTVRASRTVRVARRPE